MVGLSSLMVIRHGTKSRLLDCHQKTISKNVIFLPISIFKWWLTLVLHRLKHGYVLAPSQHWLMFEQQTKTLGQWKKQLVANIPINPKKNPRNGLDRPFCFQLFPNLHNFATLKKTFPTPSFSCFKLQIRLAKFNHLGKWHHSPTVF